MSGTGRRRIDGPLGRALALLLFLACLAAIHASWRAADESFLLTPRGGAGGCLEKRLATIGQQRKAGVLGPEQAMMMRQQAARECN